MAEKSATTEGSVSAHQAPEPLGNSRTADDVFQAPGVRWTNNGTCIRLVHVEHHLEARSKMNMMRPPSDRDRPRGIVDRSLQAQLGRQLRSIYQDVADEPVPDRFIELLKMLEDKETGQPRNRDQQTADPRADGDGTDKDEETSQ
jgi:hypothetical protein